MAVTPKDSDSFVREVDDELRRERVGSFMTRYGWYILGGVALLLAAFGGYLWWQHRQTEQAGQASEKLVQVIDQLAANNARGAAPTIDELAQSDRAGYRISALFARANAQVASNSIPAAIQTLKGIVADESAPQPFRDAALIRQTQLEYDSLNPQQVVQRLQPFAQAGNAWHGWAGEMLGIALMKAQRFEQAGRIFESLAKDTAVPDSIRARAIQMASTLGIDAIQLDPALNNLATTGGPVPTPGAAGPPGAAQRPAAAGQRGAAGQAAPAGQAPASGAAARPAAPPPATR